MKKDTKRFNNKEGIEIFKITKKLIDGTTFVIFEEEDETYPVYRLENLTDDISVWFV